jgi:hypothetical protein
MVENRHMRRYAARERFCTGLARRTTLFRVNLLLLALLALTFQSLIVQTHIHVPPAVFRAVMSLAIQSHASGTLAAIEPTSRASPSGSKAPYNDDPSNCPVCQQIAHSGQFVHSAAVLTALPAFISVSAVPWAQTVIPLIALTHIWNIRAPPIASHFLTR